MDAREIESSFRDFAKGHAIDLQAAPPAVGVPAMIRFYSDLRADGCDKPLHDMLLFQWGTYDKGKGQHFELDITRQVVLPDEEDDDAIWQLHLTYGFSPTRELSKLGAGDRWCESPKEVTAFRTYVRSTPAFTAVAHRSPKYVDVQYECAG